MMFGHYTTSQPHNFTKALEHFEIRADNTVHYRAESGCGGHAVEYTYGWESIDEASILITSAAGGWIDQTYKIRVTAGYACDELRLEYFTAKYSLYEHLVYRGELCLSPNGPQSRCYTGWCDSAPASCEDG